VRPRSPINTGVETSHHSRAQFGIRRYGAGSTGFPATSISKYRCVPTVTSVLPTTPSFSAPRDRSFALSKRWSGQTRVAVDSDEAIVLHQISSPPGPFLWIRTTLPDAVATIDAIMVRALPGMARKHEPTER
jgi:hypothetical protein